MGKKSKQSEGLLWFRIYSTSRGTFDSIENEKIGEAFKIALRYFEAAARATAEDSDSATAAAAAAKSIEDGITDPITKIAFMTFKTGIEDSIAAHEFNIQAGKRGQEERQRRAEEQKKAEELQKALEKYGSAEPKPGLVQRWENN